MDFCAGVFLSSYERHVLFGQTSRLSARLTHLPGSHRILVVEDQPDSRRIIRDMLASTDYEIIEAGCTKRGNPSDVMTIIIGFGDHVCDLNRTAFKQASCSS